MPKTIRITGSTDGIGLETAKVLYSHGQHSLLHGRSDTKLKTSAKVLSELSGDGRVGSYLADLSHMTDVESLGEAITANHEHLDVVVNNAGVFRTADTFTDDGLDIRFAVNTFAPYLLTQRLLPVLRPGARVINLSSAAQSSINLEALAGQARIPDQLNAYAQSKLALTMWSRTMADSQKENDLIVVAVNPGSLLGTKMVTEGFDMAGVEYPQDPYRLAIHILLRQGLEDKCIFEKTETLILDIQSTILISDIVHIYRLTGHRNNNRLIFFSQGSKRKV